MGNRFKMMTRSESGLRYDVNESSACLKSYHRNNHHNFAFECQTDRYQGHSAEQTLMREATDLDAQTTQLASF